MFCYYQYTKIRFMPKSFCAICQSSDLLSKRIKTGEWFIQVFKQVNKRNQIRCDIGTISVGMSTAHILHDQLTGELSGLT